MELPLAFVREMKRILGPEYEEYLSCFTRPYRPGLRVNTAKISVDHFLEIAPFHLERIPWIENGFYYREEDAPSRHPYYYAGLYYLQEPSAMTPASLMNVEPGDRILDICAAPGGKSTELGARLNGTGLLVSNDISASRARGLLKNIEVFGISNCLVLCEVPDRMSDLFPGFFDKILVDAPCSGEGMFRKDHKMIRAWQEHGPGYFAPIQRSIVKSAVKMLRPGGELLYSTCTFSPLENEGTIHELLKACPDMHMKELPGREGFSHGMPDMTENGDPELSRAVRIWPQRMEGEGHFIALLAKEGSREHTGTDVPKYGKSVAIPDEMKEFLSGIRREYDSRYISLRQDRAFYLRETIPHLESSRVLRSGLLLGECRTKRFEPSQALAMSLSGGDYESCLNLHDGDIRLLKYLKGETIDVFPGETERDRGFQLVEADGFPVGWGKLTNGILKNKYLPGWRMV